ncbi:DUF2637 domain-containing protein [Phytohabitans rumicis]|uniref:DUF2637 domain-containing protein n=1 Tax=Phytohabitans rumicis TaxID=1076125 RepID=A0A6V8LDY5_9ACTN|nr:DUF2637 domain-containing protein [Phytohabitans rumicis]GFJ92247.1 hypothetical protein Prum_058890 [Phytohabitans rumicis]
MNPTRIARNVSTVAVAAIAAWSSWSHMVHVALKFGERPEVAYVLPISVDGMLIVASTAMVDDQRAGRPIRWSARLAFFAGVGASVAANIAAAQPTFGARIVAAWPAVAILLVVEMLSRARRGPASAAPADHVNEPADAAIVATPLNPEAMPDQAPPSERAATARTSDSPRRSSAPRRRRQRGARTSEAVLRMRADHPDASIADIATHLGVTERHVRRLLMSTRTEPG